MCRSDCILCKSLIGIHNVKGDYDGRSVYRAIDVRGVLDPAVMNSSPAA